MTFNCNCLIRAGSNKFGEKLDNSSGYTGILGWLETGNVDIFLKGESQHLDEAWLGKTLPIVSDSLVVGQRIFDSTEVQYFDLIKNFNLSGRANLLFITSLLAATIVYLVLLRSRDRLKGRPLPLVLLNFIFIKRHAFTAIGGFVVLFEFYMMLTQFILTNNIKVEV